jgi:hypothetical protein
MEKFEVLGQAIILWSMSKVPLIARSVFVAKFKAKGASRAVAALERKNA